MVFCMLSSFLGTTDSTDDFDIQTSQYYDVGFYTLSELLSTFKHSF
jgi:hypothetical protein